jgi:hypothetical protein
MEIAGRSNREQGRVFPGESRFVHVRKRRKKFCFLEKTPARYPASRHAVEDFGGISE